MSGSWFGRGYKKLEDLELERQARQSSKFPRFFLKTNEERFCVFLDSDPFWFWEHQLNVDGDFRHWFTCSLGVEPCVLCDRGYTRIYSGAYTIIDLTPFTGKDGVERKYSKKLYVAGKKTLVRLKEKNERIIKKGDTLGIKGKVWRLKRLSDKSPRVGDEIEMERVFDPAKDAPGADLAPYDYEKILAPKKGEEIKALLGEHNVIDGVLKTQIDKKQAKEEVKGSGTTPPFEDDEEVIRY